MYLQPGESLEVRLDIAPTTQLDINASWALGPVSGSPSAVQSFDAQSNATTTNGMGPVTVIAAIASGYRAALKSFACKNITVQGLKCIVQKRSGGVAYLETGPILDPGDELHFSPGDDDWYILTAGGFIKVTAVGGSVGEHEGDGTNFRFHATDSLIKGTLTKTHTVDSWLVKNVTKTHTTDSVLKAFALTKSHTTDSLLKKLATTVAHTTDSYLARESDLLHYWNFDEGGGSSAVDHGDGMTSNWSGMSTGWTPTFVDVPVDGGNAFAKRFTSVDDSLVNVAPLGDELGSNWVMMSWLKCATITDSSSYRPFFSSITVGALGVRIIERAGGNFFAGAIDAFGDNSSELSAVVPEDEWFHWALRRQGSVWTLFVNGELIDSYTGSLATVGNGFSIKGGVSTDTFDVDDYRIYRGVLKESQIAEIVAGGTPSSTGSSEAANTAPILTTPASVTAYYPGSFVFNAFSDQISIADSDLSIEQIQVRITTDFGSGLVLALSTYTGLTFTEGTYLSFGAMTFTGTLTDVNAALLTLTLVTVFGPTAGTVTIVANDLGHEGTGGALTDSADIDVTVAVQVTKTHTTDAFLKAIRTKTHTTDSLLFGSVTKTHTTDSLLFKSGITKTHTTDSLLLKAGSTKTHTTDSYVVKNVTKTHTTDSYLASGIPFLDNFTDTDATNVTSHTSDSGHTWTTHPNSEDPTSTNGKIKTNRYYNLSTTSYYSSYAPTGADYTVTGVITKLSNANTYQDLWGRLSTSARTGYLMEYGTANDDFTLYKCITGSYTSLGTYTPGAGTFSNGASITVDLIMTGTSIVVKVNGTQRISVTNGDVTAAGRPGIRGNGNASTANGTNGANLDSIQLTY